MVAKLWNAYSCNWAESIDFVSSSIPSWQILTAHAQPFRGARDLGFYLKVPLDSLLVWASSGGSGETERMRRLAWTFAVRIGDKYQIRLTRPIWWMNVVVGILIQCDKFWAETNNVGQWSIFFHGTVVLLCRLLYLEYFLMNKPHSLDNGSVWHKDWPLKYMWVIYLYFMIFDFDLYTSFSL